MLGRDGGRTTVQRLLAAGADPRGEAPRRGDGAIPLGDRGGGAAGVPGPAAEGTKEVMATATRGIEMVLIETHNWGKTVAFWKSLGYELEFETDHHSGQLRHPAGGPALFIAERPPGQALQVVPGVKVAR